MVHYILSSENCMHDTAVNQSGNVQQHMWNY